MASSKFRKVLSILRKIIVACSNLAGYAGMFAILASVLFIVYEVVVRYFFKMPTVWEIEASIFGLIFITFVGSVFALKNDAHIKLDIVTIKLPKINLEQSGIYYFILKQLAWANIPVQEVISTTHEITLVVKEEDINRTLSILIDLKKV